MARSLYSIFLTPILILLRWHFHLHKQWVVVTCLSQCNSSFLLWNLGAHCFQRSQGGTCYASLFPFILTATLWGISLGWIRKHEEEKERRERLAQGHLGSFMASTISWLIVPCLMLFLDWFSCWWIINNAYTASFTSVWAWFLSTEPRKRLQSNPGCVSLTQPHNLSSRKSIA